MDLTAVAPFRLAAFDVTPARCEVAGDGQVARLEPKVMAVLVVLARRAGETVSREKLFEEVWDGRIVTDDALTRCISALRRVLRDGEGVEIKALPKLGYVLTVDAAPALAIAGPTPNRALPPSAALIGVGVALTLGVAALLSFRAQPESVADAQTRPLTTTPGLELYPALAPAGGQLAFAHRDATGQWDLYVKSLAGGEPQRLTNDAARERHPAWSRAGDELVFVRHDGDACEIMRLAVPGGAPRPVAACGAKLVHSLDWSPDGTVLALTVSDAPLDAGRLKLVALSGDAPAAPDQTLAAEDARFSPDGKTLALTLATAIGAEDVYTLDLASRGLARVTHDNAKVHGLDWSADGRSFVYGSNRAGSFGLHRVRRDGGAPISLMPSLQDVENPTVAGDRIVYEAWTETGRLNATALEAGKPQPALPPDSTRLEWHPDVAADGAIVFVSDRGGAPEVWLSEAGRVRQLTFFGDAYIHTPKFSPDGGRIAFSAPQGGRFGLFLVDRNGKQTRLTESGANDMSPAWSPDGRTLYFTSDRSGAWRVWKIDLATSVQSQASQTPARAVYVAGARLLTVDPVKGGLHEIARGDPDAPAATLVGDLAPSDWANIAVAGASVFYVRREPPDRAVLHRFDLATREDESVADLPEFYFRSGLTVVGGHVVYATTKVEDVSLMLFEPRSLASN
jgi:Tol biopolymer transport system component/DNA-binding winged helix-turn-helix (wHTH) protein